MSYYTEAEPRLSTKDNKLMHNGYHVVLVIKTNFIK